MSVETNLPATTTETGLAEVGAVPAAAPEPQAAHVQQPMHVAYLPLGLAVFVIIAFVMTAWTFLAATP